MNTTLSPNSLSIPSIAPPQAIFSKPQSTGYDLSVVDATVRRYYPALLPAVHAALAVFGAMALRGRTKPLSLIFEAPSGQGKSATLQMAFPKKPDSELHRFVYRSDNFTPKALVTHVANVSAERLEEMDLLRRLHDKVLITKELAPILRGRKEDLQDKFSTLIAVLDGKGLISDTGMRGRRGYQDPHIFNWLGATTPLPPSTHRMMAQLGTRLLFYELQMPDHAEEDLLAYIQTDTASAAEDECQAAVNAFLLAFFEKHPIGSVPPDSLPFDGPSAFQLLRWAHLVVQGRAAVNFDEATGEPVSVSPAEGPHRVIDYLKELARGHALAHQRTAIDPSDLALVGEVALSSIPGHLRPIVRYLRRAEEADSAIAARVCRVSRPTARQHLAELSILGLGDLTKGNAPRNEPDALKLSQPFQWLREP